MTISQPSRRRPRVSASPPGWPRALLLLGLAQLLFTPVAPETALASDASGEQPQPLIIRQQIFDPSTGSLRLELQNRSRRAITAWSIRLLVGHSLGFKAGEQAHVIDSVGDHISPRPGERPPILPGDTYWDRIHIRHHGGDFSRGYDVAGIEVKAVILAGEAPYGAEGLGDPKAVEEIFLRRAILRSGWSGLLRRLEALGSVSRSSAGEAMRFLQREIGALEPAIEAHRQHQALERQGLETRSRQELYPLWERASSASMILAALEEQRRQIEGRPEAAAEALTSLRSRLERSLDRGLFHLRAQDRSLAELPWPEEGQP